jgi:hypothetical protein
MAARCVRSFHLRLAFPSTRFTASIKSPSASSSRLQNQIRQEYSLTPCYSSRLYSTTDEDAGEKKRVVFLGTPEVAATTLRKLHEDSVGKYEIVCVIREKLSPVQSEPQPKSSVCPSSLPRRQMIRNFWTPWNKISNPTCSLRPPMDNIFPKDSWPRLLLEPLTFIQVCFRNGGARVLFNDPLRPVTIPWV